MKRINILLVGATLVWALTLSPCLAQSVDLSSWTEQPYPSGLEAGDWTVAPDNLSVLQSTNGNPTLFCSDFNILGEPVGGFIEVAAGSGDDDFIGFVLGLELDETTNSPLHDFLLVDWKKGTQGSGGVTGCAGVAASRVSGTPKPVEFWGHYDKTSDPDGSVEELARGIVLGGTRTVQPDGTSLCEGGTGWQFHSETDPHRYSFAFELTETHFTAYVDGVKEIDLDGTFADGRLCFYNYSQKGVTYSNYEILKPDLAAVSVFGSVAAPNQPLVFDAANLGTVPWAGPVTWRVRLTNGAGEEVFLAEEQVEMDLDAGSTQQVTTAFHLPANLPGDEVYVEVVADPYDTINEADESNNTLTVTDPLQVLKQLTVTSSRDTVAEGDVPATFQVTVTRSGPRTDPLTVTLEALDWLQGGTEPTASAELTVPSELTFPAGQSSVLFEAEVVQDTADDGTVVVELRASAELYGTGHDSVAVEDDDELALSLSYVDPVPPLQEGDVIEVTVERIGAGGTELESAVGVLLQVTDSSVLRFRTASGDVAYHEVEIPAQALSATFEVVALDDERSGSRGASVQAVTVDYGPAELALVVEERPRLTLSLDRGVVTEGDAVQAEVRRNVGTDEVSVDLTSSDDTEVAPQTVTIPAGDDSVTFAVPALADGDGEQAVTLTATAAGHDSGEASLIVTDQLLPNLTVVAVADPGTGETGEDVSVSYTVRNEGPGVAGTFVEKLWLSDDATLDGDDLLLAELSSSGMDAGAEAVRQAAVTLPEQVGSFFLAVTLDDPGEVPEQREDDNALVAPGPLTIDPAYTATVADQILAASVGTTVLLQGTATRSDGTPAAYVPVAVDVRVRGTERTLTAYTGSDGAFTTFFRPLPAEGGHYEVAAAHPAVVGAPAQDSFDLVGVRTTPRTLSHRVVEGVVSGPFQVTLRNLAEVEATVTAPASLQVTDPPGGGPWTLGASGELSLTYTIDALDAGAYSFEFQVDHVLGDGNDVPVVVEVLPPVARRVAEPGHVAASVVREGQKSVTFELRNDGGAEAQDVEVLLPGADWMHLAAPASPVALGVGETLEVTVVLTPPLELDLGEHSGTMVVRGTGFADLTVPFRWLVLSDAIGELEILATDEAYYFAEGSPPLGGARVTVRDPYTLEEAAAPVFTDDVTGLALVPGLVEGDYLVEVTADNHDPWRKTVRVEAGTGDDGTKKTAFLSYQALHYHWTVTEIAFEERYTISIETTFETVVPKPVVTVEPPVIDLAEVGEGETLALNMVLTNHGLIAAQDVVLDFPENHPAFGVQVLSEELGTMAAGEVLVVPVLITRTPASQTLGSGGEPACHSNASARWSYVCGGEDVNNGSVVPITNVEPCPDGGPLSGATIPHDREAHGGGQVTISHDGDGDGEEDDKCLCDSDQNRWTVDISPLFSPAAQAAEIYLQAQVGGVFQFSVTPKAQASIGKCCYGNQGYLEGRGEASLRVGARPLTDFKVPIDVVGLDLGGGGELAVKGELWAGLQAEPYVSVAGTYSTGCGEGEQWSMTGKVGFDAKVGASGKLSAVIAVGGVTTPIEVSANAFIASGLSGSLIFAKDQPARVCGDYDGVYIEASVSWPPVGNIPGGSIDPWTNEEPVICENAPAPPPGSGPRHYLVCPVTYCIPSAPPPPPSALAPGLLPEPLAGLVAKLGNDPGVCAQVRLRIDQDLVLARSIFRAGLELDNALETAVESIGMRIDVTDASGAPANHLFEIREPDLEGIEGTGSGDWSLAAESAGTFSWAIIPLDEAAAQGPTSYEVSGLLTYVQDGVSYVVPLQGTPIVVQPTAALYVDYFHERDVYADDPFTPEVEPSIPFSLGVLVDNQGPGTASNLRITSGQPEIIENEKGLKVGFEIIGTQVGAEPATPSLTADFGDLAPDETAVARWLMTSTLQGLFIDYEASFTEEHDLGEDLSQLKSVEIHETNRVVDIDDPALPDFLVNDVPDFEDLPETVYTAAGDIHAVTVVTEGTITTNGNDATVQVTSSGWTYVRLDDPFAGALKLSGVDRGTVPLGAANFWSTDRTFIGLGQRPVDEDLVHFFDDFDPAGATVTYTLHFVDPPVMPLCTEVDDLPPASPELFPVSWSDGTGCGSASYDVYVSVDGGAFTLWLEDTHLQGAVYEGTQGSTYAFYSVGRDAAGNLEPAPSEADASTTVSLFNTAPVLDAPAPVLVDEGEVATTTLSATDADGDALRFAVVSGPAGVGVDPLTGVLTWQTGEVDGSATPYTVTVSVTDSGYPPATTEGTVSITVTEMNSSPRLDPIPVQHGDDRSSLSFATGASDDDLPAQTLSFSLADAPAGAEIDAATGLVTWPSPVAGTHVLRVQVDDGAGGVAEAEVLLVIEAAPAILPGTGSVQAQDESLSPDGLLLMESLWQANVLYRRHVPVIDGRVERALAGPWQVVPMSLPGTGDVQSYCLYGRPDGSVDESLWQGDQGFERVVPVTGGVVDWPAAGSWSAPLDLDALPGAGSVQAAGHFISADGASLQVTFWRGHLGYGLSVPIIDGQLRWNLAPPYRDPLRADLLPGWGEMQSQSNFLSPDGTSLEQVFWRGGFEYRRGVPVVGGQILWSQGGDFLRRANAADLDGEAVEILPVIDGGELSLPGTGDVQAQDEILAPNFVVFLESFWQGNVLYRRQIPNVNGQPDRSAAGPWEVVSMNLPGSGDVQVYDLYYLPDGSGLGESLWRGDEGFFRTVPFTEYNDLGIEWSAASAWSTPMDLTIFPGTGSIESADNRFSIVDSFLYQSFWQGGLGYFRSVPVVAGQIDWPNASPYVVFLPEQMPGSGARQGESSYLSPNGLERVFWRGGFEYRQTVPVVGGQILWDEAGPFVRRQVLVEVP